MNDGKRKRYRIADAEIEIAFTENYTEIICRDYEVKAEGKPDFVIEVTDEEVEREKKKSEPGASKGIIESLAIYRKLCEKILDRNCVLFHCSAVAVDGKAYLFTAASGTGKSTHTRMWRQHFGGRAVMVNDDKPILRIKDDGIYVCGTPWCGKHGLQTNVEVPVQGICILRRGEENMIRKKVLSFLLAGVLTLGCFPVTAGATNNSKDGTKPADGTTVEQPFPKTLFLEEHNSSKGFTRFRIPALVTAGNGALIAATDIRWDIC